MKNVLLLVDIQLHASTYFWLQEIINLLEVALYEKVHSYYNKYLDIELEKHSASYEVFNVLKERTQATSRARNYEMFLMAYPSLSEHVT